MKHIKYQNRQEITVGIPTYYGGKSLVKTMRQLRKSKDISKFKIIVSVDGKNLHKSIKRMLIKQNVKILENKKRIGQYGRIKQLVDLCSTTYLILVQDDIVVDNQMLAKILRTFEENKKITMIAPKVKSAHPQNLFQKILNVGVVINYEIGTNWKNADNYLLSSGRTLAFRTSFIKQFSFPFNVVNSDAFLYFENKKRGGKFIYLPTAVSYNQLVNSFSAHLKQSLRFQGSELEVAPYFANIKQEYKFPKVVAFRVIISQLIKNPFFTICYLFVLVYTRLVKSNLSNFINAGTWKSAENTKK